MAPAAVKTPHPPRHLVPRRPLPEDGARCCMLPPHPSHGGPVIRSFSPRPLFGERSAPSTARGRVSNCGGGLGYLAAVQLSINPTAAYCYRSGGFARSGEKLRTGRHTRGFTTPPKPVTSPVIRTEG